MTSLSADVIQASSDAALTNYSRWINTGFWASFLLLDDGPKLRHFKKLPSAHVFEQMCNSFVGENETVTAEEMEKRLSFMEAVLSDMRKKESDLFEAHFKYRRRGMDALFLLSMLMIMLIGIMGIQPGLLPVISSITMIALSGITFIAIRSRFKSRYTAICGEAESPGNRQRYILWGA